MQKDQCGRCVVSSVPHIGLHTVSKSTFKNQGQKILVVVLVTPRRRSGAEQVSSVALEEQFRSRRFETKNVHRSKD